MTSRYLRELQTLADARFADSAISLTCAGIGSTVALGIGVNHATFAQDTGKKAKNEIEREDTNVC
jgi:hypothetical protein